MFEWQCFLFFWDFIVLSNFQSNKPIETIEPSNNFQRTEQKTCFPNTSDLSQRVTEPLFVLFIFLNVFQVCLFFCSNAMCFYWFLSFLLKTQEKQIDNQQKPIKPSNKNIKHKENLFQDSSACNGNVLETLFSLIVFFCFSFCRFLEVWWFFIVFQFLFFWLLSCFMKHGWKTNEGQSNRQQQSK